MTVTILASAENVCLFTLERNCNPASNFSLYIAKVVIIEGIPCTTAALKYRPSETASSFDFSKFF